MKLAIKGGGCTSASMQYYRLKTESALKNMILTGTVLVRIYNIEISRSP